MPNLEFICRYCDTVRKQFIYQQSWEKYIVRCPKLNCHKPMLLLKTGEV